MAFLWGMKNKNKTVLIVDDSILILERMIPLMEEIEHISFVIHAATYKEGLEVLSRLTPDMGGFLERTRELIEKTYRDNGNRPFVSDCRNR